MHSRPGWHSRFAFLASLLVFDTPPIDLVGVVGILPRSLRTISPPKAKWARSQKPERILYHWHSSWGGCEETYKPNSSPNGSLVKATGSAHDKIIYESVPKSAKVIDLFERKAEFSTCMAARPRRILSSYIIRRTHKTKWVGTLAVGMPTRGPKGRRPRRGHGGGSSNHARRAYRNQSSSLKTWFLIARHRTEHGAA
ncbi:hypothetical protein BJ546DRAFT_436676 [Cryomyces antarcticus]